MQIVPLDSYLKPGQLLDIVFKITAGTPAEESETIAYIKRQVSEDKRWHYGGSRREERIDPGSGLAYNALVISVQVADPAKVYGDLSDPTNVQEANIAGWVIVAAGMVLSVATMTAGWLIDRQHERKFRWMQYESSVVARLTEAGERFKWPVAAVLALVIVGLVLRGK